MTESSEARLSSDIYDILEACTSDELGPLVLTLVNSSVSHLKITRGFERFHPDHVRYAEQIADEIYRLGISALGRTDGRRPSYEEFLLALCKQIGLPIAVNDVGANEAVLLNIFARQHLSSLPATERQQVVDESSLAVSGAAKGILSSDAWPPFASTLLQAVHLRHALVKEGRIPAEFDGGAVDVVGGVPALTNTPSDALVVQTEDGRLILSLASFSDDHGEGWQSIDGKAKLPDLIYPILKGIEPLLSAGQLLKGQHLYTAEQALSFSGKVGGHVGVARGVKGMVPLKEITLASVGGPAVIIAFAAAYFEQKKFENIEKSLNEIKTSLADVAKFQQNERRSVLTGSIRYFQQIAPAILAGELASEVLHEIERHEVELGRVQEHLIWDVQNQIAVLRSIKKEGWVSGGKYTSAIQDAQSMLDRMYDEVLLCIRARACGYQLLCSYPGRDMAKKARLDDINKALALFAPTGEATVALDLALREKMQGISSYETKALVLAKENALFERIMGESNAIGEGLRSVALDPAERADPILIELKMEDGRIVAMR